MFTINSKVQSHLEKLLHQHRLVFWYDDQAEMKGLFENLEIAGVEKLVIDNNEFSLKHKLLIEKPAQRFLLYQPKAKPNDHENWLLDLLLSHYEFRTEAASLYLQDLDLSNEFKPLVQQHESFFAAEKRMQELKGLLEPNETERSVRLKMLAVVCGCEPNWEKVLYALFAELQKGKSDKYQTIEKFGLRDFIWETVQKTYNYKSPGSTIKDLVLHFIQDNFERTIPFGIPVMNKEAYLFVNRWKENTRASQSFYDWAKLLEQELNIEPVVQKLQPESLLEADTYPVIDQKLVISIREHVLKNTLPNNTLQQWIEKRKVKFYYKDFAQIYQALSHAAYLLDEIRKMNVSVTSPKDGFDKYEKLWFKIDRLYRNYIYASGQAEHQNILKGLTLEIEKAYGNSYLLKLGDNWQAAIDGMQTWSIEKIVHQRAFYNQWVAPYTKNDKRVFVVISDALRYESAAELREMILLEDRFTATLSAALGSLPSYTQLGMASLLPHDSLAFSEQSEIVFADGVSTQGTANRTRILQKRYIGSVAITAEDFLKLKSNAEGRDFIKPYNIIYIYSNHIDKIGDDKTSEGTVFDATEDEFRNILRIIKHIHNMNGYNMIVTADHGYLYQHNRLEESDFTDYIPAGKVYKSSRRFVLGKDLVPNASVQKWKGLELGFGDDTEVLIPKSINRMRVQGAGSRFVHGGASLQEIMIPVLEINKARKSDIEQVDIDIISGSSNITSNSFAVSFYQKQPLGDKVQPRQMKAAFYTTAGQIISNVAQLLFNSAEKDAVAREKRQTFLFNTGASQHNGQDVYLKLDEQIEGTSQFKTYRSITYRMLIAFSSEFDDL